MIHPDDLLHLLPASKRKHPAVLLSEKPDSRFAVFRRGSSAQSSKLQSIHASFEDAKWEAQSLAHEFRAKADTVFYVLEVKYRVGIENGKPVDMKIGD